MAPQGSLPVKSRLTCLYSQTKEWLTQPNQPVWVARQMMKVMCFSRTHVAICHHRTLLLNLPRNRSPVSLYRFTVHARSRYTGSLYVPGLIVQVHPACRYVLVPQTTTLPCANIKSIADIHRWLDLDDLLIVRTEMNCEIGDNKHHSNLAFVTNVFKLLSYKRLDIYQ